MWHKKGYKKLNRTSAHRNAMLRNMATNLIERGYYETTVEKAKALRPVVEKLVTKAKKNTLAAQREAYSFLMNKGAVRKLFSDVAPRFATRAGGYLRIVRTGYRHGDAAQKALIAFVDATLIAKKSKLSTTAPETSAQPAA